MSERKQRVRNAVFVLIFKAVPYYIYQAFAVLFRVHISELLFVRVTK